ncbi:vWA domain-containing protein [Derxia lacustris]|uniref:vWA domain-containing protein n=1 Tax=Derxia lacustris TaxID=764842 RepID=UPI000A170F07|nr:vWA domain-containing protein [Derxia lacustris]
MPTSLLTDVFTAPGWLLLALPALAMLGWHGPRAWAHGHVAVLPADPPSRLLGWALRLAAALALGAIALALAGPRSAAPMVERTGLGAHVVIAIDRSASMADDFAGHGAGSRDSGEAKGEAAARLIDRLVEARPGDRFAVTGFSTAPLPVLGLGDDPQAVRAAVRASAWPGVGLTNIAGGLALALEQFRDQPMTGARVVLLVSDGAAHIDPRAQAMLRQLFAETRASLHWVFLRTAGGPAPTVAPGPDDHAEPSAEWQLDRFFRDIGAPYRLYEADNPAALDRAIADIASLHNLPLRTRWQPPPRDLAPAALTLALACCLLLLAARLAEVVPGARE